MSRRYKCLALISLYCHLFSNRLSVDLLSWGVILLPIDVTFLWLEYDRIMAKSDDPNVMAIHVSLNSRLRCLTRVSWIVAMIFFLWPESGPCLAEDFRTGKCETSNFFLKTSYSLLSLNSRGCWFPVRFGGGGVWPSLLLYKARVSLCASDFAISITLESLKLTDPSIHDLVTPFAYCLFKFDTDSAFQRGTKLNHG